MKKGAKLGIVLGIIAVLLIPAYFIGRTFGLFQGEVVLTRYALAIEVDGRKYDVLPLISSFAAMDKRGEDRQFYYQAERSDINYLFQLAYKEFEPEPSDDNPYLAGKIQYGGERDKYVTEVRQYENARDSKQIYQFHDGKGRLIYTYDPEAPIDRDYMKEIIAAGMTRHTGGGQSEVIDPYINITKLFKDKLGIRVNLDVDAEAKLVTISMEQGEDVHP
ncbi:hypothetical protein [Paenibacillus dendritiformis]|uniref:hypothetical protein n=1 Tax=Paenibacillus dendritiformis TaxID=130049 RepID=UPI00387E12C8